MASFLVDDAELPATFCPAPVTLPQDSTIQKADARFYCFSPKDIEEESAQTPPSRRMPGPGMRMRASGVSADPLDESDNADDDADNDPASPSSVASSTTCSHAGPRIYSRDAPSVDRLAMLLGDDTIREQLSSVSDTIVSALAALAEQTIIMGIDYRRVKLGWHNPCSRLEYRVGRHQSILCPPSRQRAAESKRRLAESVAAIGDSEATPHGAAGQLVLQAFLHEIGLPEDSVAREKATFDGVAAALDAELVLPLRALAEAELSRTMNGMPLPQAGMKAVVESIIGAVVASPDGYAEWRYTCPVGREQLRGLTDVQVSEWRDPSEMEHKGGIKTHEDAHGELGFFWATKIGGPSHGFDYEAQCLLPLLANARHKVILVSDSQWPEHPAGRAHWRLLWHVVPEDTSVEQDAQISTDRDPADDVEDSMSFQVEGPRLWLEAVNCDFIAASAGIDAEAWRVPVMLHAMSKADAMGVPLSVDECMEEDLERAFGARAEAAAVDSDVARMGDLRQVSERLLLRPSNAIVEASDYLSHLHDWVQVSDEVTAPISRILYLPPSCCGMDIQS